MRSVWLLVLVSTACGAPPSARTESATESPATETPAGCIEAADVVATEGTRYEDVAAGTEIPWPTPGVAFAASVTRDGSHAHVEATITNTTDAEVSIDYLTGGVMGLSTNPFDVAIEGVARTGGGPEVYPTGRRAILPAHGTLVFTLDRCPPSFPAVVRWTFSPWRGPPELGTATLP